MKKLFNDGEICEKTEIWAEGFDKWCQLSSVSQFRWTICAAKNQQISEGTEIFTFNSDTVKTNSNLSLLQGALYNLSEMCGLILETLIQMCAFFPSK